MADAIEDTAMRLLQGFYDLSGGNTSVEVPVGTPGMPEGDSAALKAGINPLSNTCDLAADHLLMEGYVQRGRVVGGFYRITPKGIGKVREVRGRAFLEAVYELASGHPEQYVDFREVMERLGVGYDEYRTIAQFLETDGYLEVMGGMSSRTALTPEGVRMVEGEETPLSSLNRHMECPPLRTSTTSAATSSIR